MKIAIVHDWLTVYAGAERVLEHMLACYPQADIFSLVDFIPSENRGFLLNKSTKTSFIQHFPFSKSLYRSYLPLMPLAVEQFDLSEYDLIISSSHAVAKGVITGPQQLHVCMCYSPMRYAWDLQHQYLKESSLDKGLRGWVAKFILHRMRVWDLRTSNSVDEFISISSFIKRRIWKVYRRESTVIYPPVDTDYFSICREKAEFYVTASRMVPYKKIDVIVEAFSKMPDKRLIVIGDGPDYQKIKKLVSPNVELLGYQKQAVLLDYLQKAKAFLFAAEEDFGIAPLEAQACGTPVIAYGKGGALETIVADVDCSKQNLTGLFFYEQTANSICDAVKEFEVRLSCINTEQCRENAERFSERRFQEEFIAFIDQSWRRHCDNVGYRE